MVVDNQLGQEDSKLSDDDLTAEEVWHLISKTEINKRKKHIKVLREKVSKENLKTNRSSISTMG